MKHNNIEELVDKNSNSISYGELQDLLDTKLEELYKKGKITNLLDYDDIRNSAMIGLIYELMPSLKDKIDLEESDEEARKTVLVKS